MQAPDFFPARPRLERPRRTSRRCTSVECQHPRRRRGKASATERRFSTARLGKRNAPAVGNRRSAQKLTVLASASRRSLVGRERPGVTAFSGGPESLQNFPRERLFDFGVARNCFHDASTRIDPQRVRTTFTLQITPRMSQPLLQLPTLHQTAITVWIASSGRPRRASSTRSSKINRIASRTLVFASSTVSP